MKRNAMFRKILFPLICLMLVSGQESCKTFAGANPSITVVAPVLEDQQFSTFRNLLRASGWADKLQNRDVKYTLFAPNNDAFLKLGNSKIAELMKPENSSQLKDLVERHIYTGSLDKETLIAAGSTPASVSGKTFPIHNMKGKWYIGNAHPTRNPVLATNGMLYEIDAVLE